MLSDKKYSFSTPPPLPVVRLALAFVVSLPMDSRACRAGQGRAGQGRDLESANLPLVVGDWNSQEVHHKKPWLNLFPETSTLPRCISSAKYDGQESHAGES